MNCLNKIRKFLTDNKLNFILFAVFVAFHSFFETYITTLFVNTFFCYLKPSWIIDCLSIISLILIICYFRKSIKSNTYISNQIIGLSILLLIIFGYYRITANIWTFVPMSFFNKIKHIDILQIFLLSNICIGFCHKKKNYTVKKEDGFYFDNPIEDANEDILHRNNVAERVVKKIKKTANLESAFAIGICSEWGNGKTSFLNLLESTFDKKDRNRIIVKFNPWLNNDENAIVTAFFDELSQVLKPYNKELSKNLIEYAEILNATGNDNIEKTLNFFKANHSNNLRTKFKSINDAIKNSGKQIIIFIDDLDRLYEKEILEVLRLIRNSANFTNTVFVVAYDRNYLISALRKVNEHRPNFYLEKIFQLEIELPKFSNSIFAFKLKEALLPYLAEEDKTILEKSLKNRKFKYSLFANIRDINRFVNSFILSYELLREEVDLIDLLNLELLRIKYLGVYQLFAKDYMDFLENTKKYTNDTDYYLCVKKLRDKDDNKKVLEKTVLEEYLEIHYTDVGIQKNQITDVLIYVLNVFSYSAYGSPNNGLLSISNPAAIERYFHYNLLSSNLSEIEFSKYRQKSEQEFQEKIIEWENKGLSNEVAARLERINFYQNKEDYEKIINAIFFYASILIPDGRCLGFDCDNLCAKLKYNSVEQFYTEEEFKAFVKELFNRQNSPYLFVSIFINQIIYDIAFEWKFIISKDDLINQKLICFKQYSENIDKIDRYFFWLYDYCGYTEWVDNGNNSRSPREVLPSQDAKNIFIECAKRLGSNFLLYILKANGKGKNINELKPVYCVDNRVSTIWDGWNDFEKFLLEQDEKQVPIIKEFRDFFNKCKEVNFQEYIEYTFKEIDLAKNN